MRWKLNPHTEQWPLSSLISEWNCALWAAAMWGSYFSCPEKQHPQYSVCHLREWQEGQLTSFEVLGLLVTCLAEGLWNPGRKAISLLPMKSPAQPTWQMASCEEKFSLPQSLDYQENDTCEILMELLVKLISGIRGWPEIIECQLTSYPKGHWLAVSAQMALNSWLKPVLFNKRSWRVYYTSSITKAPNGPFPWTVWHLRSFLHGFLVKSLNLIDDTEIK